MAPNRLYFGDNLTVLRESIVDESIDLVYLDPPFNSKADYNILFKTQKGTQSEAQVSAFQDTWHWNEESELAFREVLTGTNAHLAKLMAAIRAFLGETDLMAYLAMMAIRLQELHRVLKPTGSLYLHCDSAAVHYLKMTLDAVFSPKQYRNEIVWKRTSGHSDAKKYGRIHDVILYYTKSDEFVWNDVYQEYDPSYVEKYYRYSDEEGRKFMSGDLSAAGLQGGGYEYEWNGHTRVWRVPYTTMQELETNGLVFYTKNGMPRRKRYLDEMPGLPAGDVWADIEPLRSWHKEKLGYPTQKPLALLDRIISASSRPGDVVLDPFCGCGTALHAANELKRNWVGIDITHLAISLIENRLRTAFANPQFETIGTPKDVPGAEDLARRDKYQFEWWALSLVNAIPAGNKKKGADKGVDGHLYFWPEGKAHSLAVVSVKGGKNIEVAMVRDLVGAMQREKAEIGLFISLAEPTKPMRDEALSHGFMETQFGKYPRVQLITIRELLAGAKPNIPLIDSTFKRDAHRQDFGSKQSKLSGNGF